MRTEIPRATVDHLLNSLCIYKYIYEGERGIGKGAPKLATMQHALIPAAEGPQRRLRQPLDYMTCPCV